jgi:hypothetical protein
LHFRKEEEERIREREKRALLRGKRLLSLSPVLSLMICAVNVDDTLSLWGLQFPQL